MWLPTKSQVDAASRHLITVAGTVIALLGLQSKGFTLEQVTAAINSLGSVVNNIVLLIAALAPIYAGWKASRSASPKAQAVAVAATGALVVGSPELAAATPNSPNIVSMADVKVTTK